MTADLDFICSDEGSSEAVITVEGSEYPVTGLFNSRDMDGDESGKGDYSVKENTFFFPAHQLPVQVDYEDLVVVEGSSYKVSKIMNPGDGGILLYLR